MEKTALVLRSSLLSFFASSGSWIHEVYGLGHAPQSYTNTGLEQGCYRALEFTPVIINTSKQVLNS